MIENHPTQHPYGPPVRPRAWYRQPALWLALAGGAVFWGAAAAGSTGPDTTTAAGDAEALDECHNRVADEAYTPTRHGTEEWSDEDVTNRGGGEYLVTGHVDGGLYTCVITRSGGAWRAADNILVFDEDEGPSPSTTGAPATTTAPPATTTTVPPTTVPPTTTTTAPPEDPQVSNARRSAASYLDFRGFSRQGLIDQLSSEYGDQYPVEAATAAVDSLNVDWNAEAVEAAESYLELRGFSHAGLVDQLSSEYGDQFTREQAEHGATVALGA